MKGWIEREREYAFDTFSYFQGIDVHSYDTGYGAGNMAGRQRGSAACFNRLYPKAIHHYCSSQDLCKTCEVKEIHLMLNSIKQLGFFLITYRNGDEY